MVIALPCHGRDRGFESLRPRIKTLTTKEATRAIIENDKGQVLMGKRAQSTGQGKYALVGGKPDQGEIPQHAIVREIKEELGLDFNPTPIFERVDHSTDPKNPWKTYFFTGVISGELQLNEEISEIVFVSEADLEKLDIAFDHRERLKDYFNHKRAN